MAATTQKPDGPHLGDIFNFGIKAPDVEAERAFFAAFNPDRIYTVRFGAKEVAAVDFAGVRFFLFPALAYEAELPNPHPGGFGHVSFMVDDLGALMENLARCGVKPFRGPYEASLGDLGKRMVAMFRSPNGTLISAIPRL